MDVQMSTCIRLWWSGRGPFPAVGGLTSRWMRSNHCATLQPPSFHRTAALASELALALAGAGDMGWLIALSVYEGTYTLAQHCRYSEQHPFTRADPLGTSSTVATQASHGRTPRAQSLDPATR